MILRRLVLMRHAKSSWTSTAGSDHARPLNPRGRRDAPRIAERLVQLDWVPERVVSSDAARTRETWARMADRLPAPIDVCFTRRLYDAGSEAVERVLGEQPDSVRTLLLLGHNPTFELLVERLTGQAQRMTTANAALLEQDCEDWWSGTVPGSWRLARVLRPKELG